MPTRIAEAAALRVAIANIAKGGAAPVVVIGDMNDGDHRNTLNVLTEQPAYLDPSSCGKVSRRMGGDRRPVP